jgi:hypothetical protein
MPTPTPCQPHTPSSIMPMFNANPMPIMPTPCKPHANPMPTPCPCQPHAAPCQPDANPMPTTPCQPHANPMLTPCQPQPHATPSYPIRMLYAIRRSSGVPAGTPGPAPCSAWRGAEAEGRSEAGIRWFTSTARAFAHPGRSPSLPARGAWSSGCECGQRSQTKGTRCAQLAIGITTIKYVRRVLLSPHGRLTPSSRAYSECLQ